MLARNFIKYLNLSVGVAISSSALSDWPTAGYDLNNSRTQSNEKLITPKTASGLKLKWSVLTDGDVTANPAVDILDSSPVIEQ
jgi:polyvinyl alcohol dehydrogenase (cytochrome)